MAVSGQRAGGAVVQSAVSRSGVIIAAGWVGGYGPGRTVDVAPSVVVATTGDADAESESEMEAVPAKANSPLFGGGWPAAPCRRVAKERLPRRRSIRRSDIRTGTRGGEVWRRGADGVGEAMRAPLERWRRAAPASFNMAGRRGDPAVLGMTRAMLRCRIPGTWVPHWLRSHFRGLVRVDDQLPVPVRQIRREAGENVTVPM